MSIRRLLPTDGYLRLLHLSILIEGWSFEFQLIKLVERLCWLFFALGVWCGVLSRRTLLDMLTPYAFVLLLQYTPIIGEHIGIIHTFCAFLGFSPIPFFALFLMCASLGVAVGERARKLYDDNGADVVGLCAMATWMAILYRLVSVGAWV